MPRLRRTRIAHMGWDSLKIKAPALKSLKKVILGLIRYPLPKKSLPALVDEWRYVYNPASFVTWSQINRN